MLISDMSKGKKMRDALLFVHIIMGLILIVAPFFIIAGKKERWLKPVAWMTAAASWLILLPAGALYLIFYPATKTRILAGSWPWVHTVVMETKEHWGLLLPIIATMAALLIQDNKLNESKKWWILLSMLSVLLGIMGRLLKVGALK